MGIRYGGRSKGTPNKTTQSLIETCEKRGLNVFESMMACLEQITEPKEKFDRLEKLAQYIYPKRKAIEIDNHNNQIEVIIKDYTK